MPPQQYLWVKNGTGSMVFATVCSETGVSEGLICPQLNTTSVNVSLQQYSQRLASGELAVRL